MRTAVLEKLECLRIVEKPIPEPEADQVLIKVELCGICGTDFLFYDGRFPLELPYHNMGHEYIGTVEKVGENVRTVSPGDRVVINPNYHCDNCYYCQRGEPAFCQNRRSLKTKSNGGFAEYTCVNKKHVHKVPKTTINEQAIFAEPLSCCLHAIERIDLKVGDDVLIYGCGTMGLLTLQLCRLKGARRIIISEPVKMRRQTAKKLGADITVNPFEEDLKKIVSENLPTGPRIVIESSGAKTTLSETLHLISPEGQLLLLASWAHGLKTDFEPALIMEKQLSIMGSVFGHNVVNRSLNLLDSGQIKTDLLLTDIFELADLDKAMKKAKGPDAIKVAVRPC